MLVLLTFCFIIMLSTAAPHESFPISSQLPPIAQVGRSFRYQFAPTTFSSAASETLKYSIRNAPAWLHLDGATRVISGTPPADQVGYVTFMLEATDSSGAADASVTLLVTSALQIEGPDSITGQLALFGNLASADSLALYTNTAFKFTFAPNTFRGPFGMTYYATSADRSPLPSWINFDSASLTISGLTPPLIAIPQTFGISLIASTIPGYAMAAFTFYLIVNDHQLLFKPFESNVTFSNNSASLAYIVSSYLILDGTPIASQDLSATTVDSPAWLTYDAESMMLTGHPPQGMDQQRVTFTAHDRNGDTAKGIVDVHFNPPLFTREIGALVAKIGRDFTYTFPQSLFDRAVLYVNVYSTTTSPWLHFDSTNLTLFGFVPQTLEPSILRMTIMAYSAADSESQGFEILIERPGHLSRSSSSIRGIASPSQTPMTTRGPAPTHHVRHNSTLNAGQIAAITVGLILLFLILFLLLRRLFRRKKLLETTTETTSDIHIPTPMRSLKDDFNYERDVENHAGSLDQERSRSTPQIVGAIRGLHESIRSSKFCPRNAPLDGAEESVGGYVKTSGANGIELGNQRRPVKGHVNTFSSEDLDSRQRRKTALRASLRSICNPDEAVAIGLGHGRPSSHAVSGGWPSTRTSSVHYRWSTLSSNIGSRRSHLSYTHAPKKHPQSRISEETQRLSIRVVGSSDESVLDAWQRKRDSYIRQRASSARKSNPLFAANSLRSSRRRFQTLETPPERRTHWAGTRWRRFSSRSQSGHTDQSVPQSGKSAEWEDVTETERSHSVYDEDVIDAGEDMIKAQTAIDHATDPIIVAKRRGEISQAMRTKESSTPPRTQSPDLDETPLTQRQASGGQGSQKAFL